MSLALINQGRKMTVEANAGRIFSTKTVVCGSFKIQSYTSRPKRYDKKSKTKPEQVVINLKLLAFAKIGFMSEEALERNKNQISEKHPAPRPTKSRSVNKEYFVE
jgi:hypothetical protein